MSGRKTLLFLISSLAVASALPAQITCPQSTSLSGPATIKASIAAIDQPFMLNRFGAAMTQGMIFALTGDVVAKSGGGAPSAGNAMLRPNKRPRPLVLRVRQGDCLQITLTNLLGGPDPNNGTLQPSTTNVSLHVNGMQPVKGITDDATLAGKSGTVGANGSLVSQGQSTTYTLYAAEIGTYLAYSTAATAGGCTQCTGQITAGLFGAVTVEPPGAEMYRSQVTAADMAFASTGKVTPIGQPQINYTARYPASYVPPAGSNAPQACWPVLQMVALPAVSSGGQCIVQTGGPLTTYYSDLTAMITGPNQGQFTADGPEFNPVPASPNRRWPFREFTIIYHDVLSAVQAFTDYYQANTTTGTDPSTLTSVKDNFAINYGTGGIGTEILANRLNVGPNAGNGGQSNCVECKFEEFFLSAWAVGDPSMIVDYPADWPNKTTPFLPNTEGAQTRALALCATGQGCGGVQTPLSGPKATVAYFPDDPSNVYHSYLDDHVIFRILHAGGNFTHVHHQHAHQWLHSPNSPNGSYLDSQLISPGAAFTLEMVYGGSGNRNKTAGDSIFHCHFYPHFAAGMWAMWRVHDVFESGTQLNSNGTPATNARALPDGEIAAGTPIPGVVPLPTYPMALMPAATKIVPVCSSTVSPCPAANIAGYTAQTTGAGNPGYPFFVPGNAGHRAPRPPLDVACVDPSNPATCYDGGLQRHNIIAGTVTNQQQNQWDFSRDNTNHIQPGFTPPAGMPPGCAQGCILAQQLPENGTPTELAAISYMGLRNHPSFTSTGQSGYFVTNGLPRKGGSYPNGALPGAPFADPAVDDNGNAVGVMRRYKAAVVQTDVAFNKAGWHYPQQRFLTLWDDVAGAVAGGSSTYTPQPFFFRANSSTDFIEYWHMNLVPSYYQLDDYEVRTPTDILGQHIHLVKFDVLASDGAANGFNYEDGTLSPDEVRDRIEAIRNWNGCTTSSPVSFNCPMAKPAPISVTPPPGQNWTGAQVTVQRWYPDELTGCTDGRMGAGCNQNSDRTMRTVFTHDHFGPSTHQQVGLYAGLLIEPTGSAWTDPVTGAQLGTNVGRPNADGGPTSWQAIIAGGNPTFREFALEFQDLAHAYLGGSVSNLTQALGYTPYAQGPVTSTSPPVFGFADCTNVINGNKGGPTATPCTPSSTSVVPGAIDSKQSLGTMLVNYRNEPLQLRLAGSTQSLANDLSHVYSSTLTRNLVSGFNQWVNQQPPLGTCVNGSAPPCSGSSGTYKGFIFPPPFSNAQANDPYTPILQAYQGDNVQMRILVGAHFFNHNFDVQGLKWLFEPSNASSGWRDNTAMGISEHFEYLFTVPTSPTTSGAAPGGLLPFTDYLWKTGAGQTEQIQGDWGILRAYTTGGNSSKLLSNVKPLPSNASGGLAPAPAQLCTPNRIYYVAAVNLPQPVSYFTNKRNGNTSNLVTLNNLYPMLFLPSSSAGTTPPLSACTSSANCAPMVLRANAGDCVSVVLFNELNTSNPVYTIADQNYSLNGAGYPSGSTNANLYASKYVGLHAQMVSTNTGSDNGVNAGYNSQQYRDTTVGPPGVAPNCTLPNVSAPYPCIQYTWYAGNAFGTNGALQLTPIELGSANLVPSDPLEQPPHAMIGGLVVEPTNSIWCNLAKTCGPKIAVTDTTVDVYNTSPVGSPLFREFAAMVQDNVYLSSGTDMNNDTINYVAVNFGTEPYSPPGQTPSGSNQPPQVSRYSNYTAASDDNQIDLTETFADSLPINPSTTTPTFGDPQTPIFTAVAGSPVRFRMFHPDGLGGFPDNTFTLHGHVWQEEPYTSTTNTASTALGDNTLSQWMGARDGFGAGNHFDILLPRAGGVNAIQGDYLYDSFPVLEGGYGVWGLLRVTPAAYAATLKAAAVTALPPPAVTPEAKPALDPADRFMKPREKHEKAPTPEDKKQ